MRCMDRQAYRRGGSGRDGNDAWRACGGSENAREGEDGEGIVEWGAHFRRGSRVEMLNVKRILSVFLVFF